MKVGIIGAGLQCRRRAPVVVNSANTELAMISSLHLEHAREAARQFNCDAVDDWKRVVAREDIDIIVVCTPPHVHSVISIEAMKNGKHVLCEKPLTRSVKEAEEMVKTSEDTKRVLKCGFNHRHHPASLEAHKMVSRGSLGRVLFGRCRYGICGRPGYEKEWRADPEKASGGHFIEQGTHAIDLFRWLIGEITEVSCMTGIQYFTKQPLDDNGMANLRTKDGALLSLHASLTQWKNLFCFEVFGEDGYIIIEGLGSSYGTEKLTYGQRNYDAPFNDHTTEYRGGDTSWQAEWKEFCEAIIEKRLPIGNGYDGLAAMRVALACYEAEKRGTVIKI